MDVLSVDELSTNQETQKHIDKVRLVLGRFAQELISRGIEHDSSKLSKPEVEGFTEFTSKLAETDYGKDEYNDYLIQLKSTLSHHYSHNRHHPECHENGVSGMNLIDLVEMFCDWKAATSRHNNGDLSTSIILNKDRFKLDRQLVNIFKNTVEYMQMAAQTQDPTDQK